MLKANNYTILGEVTYISLTDVEGNHKEYAIIDTEDLEKIKAFRWWLSTKNSVTAEIATYTVKLHHLILNFLYDFRVDLEVDHINRNPLDNRKKNLRLVTRSVNQLNKGIRKDNTSGTKGVSYAKRRKRWHSYIKIQGKRCWLGYFKNLEDAVTARKTAEREVRN